MDNDRNDRLAALRAALTLALACGEQKLIATIRAELSKLIH